MVMRMKVVCFAILIALIFFGCYIIADNNKDNVQTTGFSQPDFVEQVTIETNASHVSTEVDSDALNEEDYWELVQEDIQNLFKEHNLFVFRIGTEIPYINYYVEYGKPSADGRYTPVGLTKEECVALKEFIQKELIEIISKYHLDEGKNFWSKPSRTVFGFFIYNRFTNTNFVPAEIDRICVSGYQVDLLDFYNKHEESNFVKMDYFESSPWDKYEIYIP